MKELFKAIGITFGIILFLVLVFGGFAWLISSQADKENKSRLESYQECKQKTSDIEWCIEKFYNLKLN